MAKKEKQNIPGQGMSVPPGPSKQSLKEADDFFKEHRRAPRAEEPIQLGIGHATGVIGWILLGILGGGCLIGVIGTLLTS